MTKTAALTITDSDGNRQTINCTLRGARQVLALRAGAGITIVSATYAGELLV